MEPKVQKLLLSFFDNFKLTSFTKGETVIKPSNRKVFFLTRGIVKMSGQLKDRELLTLNIYKPYSLFPMSPLLNNKPDKYAYTALTEVQGHFAPNQKFRQFIKKNPDVLFDLLKRIYRGLDGFFARLESLLFGDAYLRLLTHLVIYSKRFGKNSNGEHNWYVTHHQLASQTGLARETVTREIKKLQEKNLIGYKGKKLLIHDTMALEKELNTHNKLPLDKP